MFLDVKNWHQTTRQTPTYDPVANPSMIKSTFVTLNPATGHCEPLAAAYAGAGVFGVIFKGTEEQVVQDVEKLDVVLGPAVIETDNWNTVAALNVGDPVNIEVGGPLGVRLDAPGAAFSVGHILEITTDGNLVVDLRKS